jgi:hypothetical protein
VLTDEPGNAPVPAIQNGPWTNYWSIGDNGQGYVTTVPDSTGPHSPGRVIQYRYPAGFQGGVGPGKVYRDVGGATKVYAGFWWKVSNPWQGHVTGSNKVAYMMTNSNGSITLVMREQNGRYEMWVYPQFSTSSAQWLGPNRSNPVVTLGDWHLVEWTVEYTPGDGGKILWWMDGRLVGEYHNQRFPNQGLADFRLSAIWGGVGDVKRQTDYYWYDHVHIRTP